MTHPKLSCAVFLFWLAGNAAAMYNHPTATIVTLAEDTADLSTLVTALKAADLVNTLSGKGPFTVFAPTNEAFSKLPAATLAQLLKPANKAQSAGPSSFTVERRNRRKKAAEQRRQLLAESVMQRRQLLKITTRDEILRLRHDGQQQPIFYDFS